MDNNNIEQEAFDKFAGLMEDGNGTDVSYEEFMQSFDENSSDTTVDPNVKGQETEPNGTRNQDEQLSNEEGTSLDKTDPEESKENSDQASFTLDYQKLYEQNKQTYEAQLKLVTSRLKELSEKYQELKEQKAAKAKESEEIPPKLKEFYESYPDIADAVKAMVDSKLNSTVNQVEHAIATRVKPIEQNMAQESARQHIERIRSAHPDVIAIVESGDLVEWINSLPAVEREGAAYIYQQGNADQIIALLNSYKSARSAGRKPVQKAKVESAPVVNNDSTDEIVNRVLAAMNVPTPKDQIALDPRKRVKEKTFDDAVKEYEATRRAR